MQSLSYRQLNNLLGWGMGLFSMVIYTLTVEPTASYWDCSEFIAVSYKLEVPHPPGAPFYLMIGRLFSMLALGEVERVAFFVNMLSVLSSALTIVFLFWTITALAKRLFIRQDVSITGQTQWSILGAGILGGLVFTFSDSFWFSAVEAEVYALSSLFTAIIVWAILRWEQVETPRQRLRWLLFISYMIGLSIGVHLLGLLALPALSLLIYYRYIKGRPAVLGMEIFAVLVGLVAIALVMVGLIQGLPGMAAGFDIFFVNVLRLPFYSGIITFCVLLLGALVGAILWSQRHQKTLYNALFLSIAFILLGYGSYALVLIRSLENPPIDESNPESVLKFIAYLKREQYGDRPIVLGPQFDARPASRERGDAVYRQGANRYEIIEWESDPVYGPGQEVLFPRLYSTRHTEKYRKYLGLAKNEPPSSADNLRFFFGYQIGHMYVRYLMWNFAGRESSLEGADWLSPFSALKDESLPDSIKNSKGRNNYWALPFVLGLLGLFYQAWKDRQGFRFVMLLFLLMGVGLVFYLNMPPNEPRERDYIYAGSYYAFAIWVGLGFLMVVEGVRHRSLFNLRGGKSLVVAAVLCLPPVVLMAKENWDDHDRSDRYFSVDSARNLLESCAPNAILFTGGDNDTFPLWYAQEVEGIRTDVRVVVLSYFNTEWYISQMMRPAYESAPLPFTLKIENYARGEGNDILGIGESKRFEGGISLRRYLDLVRNKDKRIQRGSSGYNYIPSKRLLLEIDTAGMVAKGVVPKKFRKWMVNPLVLTLKKDYLEKKDLAILDLISAKKWSRPIYFNPTSLNGSHIDFDPHVVQEGLAYRLLPIHYDGRDRETGLMEDNILVDEDKMYSNIMEHFRFRGVANPDVYLSGDYLNFARNHRATIALGVAALFKAGDTARARQLLHHSVESIPLDRVSFDGYSIQTLAVALKLKDTELALRMAEEVVKHVEQALRYARYAPQGTINLQREVRILQQVIYLLELNDQNQAAERYEKRYAKLLPGL